MSKRTLPSGEYEVRYFLNNTYTHYKKSESFKVENKALSSQERLEQLANQEIEKANKETPMNFDTFITGIRKNYEVLKDEE